MTNTVFDADGEPPRFGPRHYVPLVKTLRGEFLALLKAQPSLRSQMTPLVEIANKQGEGEEVSPRSPLAHVVSDLSHVIGTDRHFCLDFHDGLRDKTVARLLGEARLYSLKFVPVVRPDMAQRTKLIMSGGNLPYGACLRVPLTGRVRRTGQSLNQLLEELLAAVRLPAERADLVLDLGLIPANPGYGAADIARAIGELEEIERWRNLVLIGTSIPDTLAAFDHDAIGELVRHELLFWRQLRDLPLARHPAFGDYIVQAPKRPVGMGRPVANLRYTSDSRVLIARGHKLTKGDREQYRTLCRLLTSRREFRGASYRGVTAR